MATTQDNHDIWSSRPNGTSLTRTTQYSIFKESNADSWNQISLNNIPLNTRLNFQIYHNTGESYAYPFGLDSSNGTYIGGVSTSLGKWIPVTIDILDSTVVINCEDKTTTLNHNADSVKFYWWLSRSISEVWFKDFIAYSI